MSYFIRICVAVLLLAGFAGVPDAYAQNLNIAVVDVDKILSESKAGKSVRAQLNARREAFQKEFSAREDNLTNAQKSLISKKGEMTAEEFAKQRDSFEKELRETRVLFQKRRNSLDKGLGNALASLRKNIIRVTADVADEKGYQVVLTRDSVVIVSKEMDITDIVLKRLNDKVSNIPLDLK